MVTKNHALKIVNEVGKPLNPPKNNKKTDKLIGSYHVTVSQFGLLVKSRLLESTPYDFLHKRRALSANSIH